MQNRLAKASQKWAVPNALPGSEPSPAGSFQPCACLGDVGLQLWISVPPQVRDVSVESRRRFPLAQSICHAGALEHQHPCTRIPVHRPDGAP